MSAKHTLSINLEKHLSNDIRQSRLITGSEAFKKSRFKVAFQIHLTTWYQLMLILRLLPILTLLYLLSFLDRFVYFFSCLRTYIYLFTPAQT